MAPTNDHRPTSYSPCEQVFGIAELANQILLNLPMQSILCGAQQVCRLWKNAVEDSDLVQEHLFMKPVSDKRLFMDDNMATPVYWVDGNTPEIPRTVLENPFLALLCHEDVCIKDMTFTYPQASWRKMLVTQPPIAEAVHTTDNYLSATIRRGLSETRGITLGKICDDLQGQPLVLIYEWATWTPYRGPQQLRVVKIEMRASDRVEGERVEDEHDDVWWMPDEYLYGK